MLFGFEDEFFPDNGSVAPTGNELPNFATATGTFSAIALTAEAANNIPFNASGFILEGTITSATARRVAVPEPSTLLLLLAGTAALGATHRRRSNAATQS